MSRLIRRRHKHKVSSWEAELARVAQREKAKQREFLDTSGGYGLSEPRSFSQGSEADGKAFDPNDIPVYGTPGGAWKYRALIGKKAPKRLKHRQNESKRPPRPLEQDAKRVRRALAKGQVETLAFQRLREKALKAKEKPGAR